MPARDVHHCPECAGHGFVPDLDLAISPCGECGGTGYRVAAGDLGPSHSETTRPYRYEPACRRLTLGKGRKLAAYTVSEFRPDGPGRAFTVTKFATGEHYAVLISPAGSSCDCAGKSYEASDKANWRAYHAGERTYRTLGCKHMDALHLLLREGWLDLPEGSAPAVEETEVSLAGVA